MSTSPAGLQDAWAGWGLCTAAEEITGHGEGSAACAEYVQIRIYLGDKSDGEESAAAQNTWAGWALCATQGRINRV